VIRGYASNRPPASVTARQLKSQNRRAQELPRCPEPLAENPFQLNGRIKPIGVPRRLTGGADISVAETSKLSARISM
jgi:hypothetical protein